MIKKRKEKKEHRTLPGRFLLFGPLTRARQPSVRTEVRLGANTLGPLASLSLSRGSNTTKVCGPMRQPHIAFVSSFHSLDGGPDAQTVF